MNHNHVPGSYPAWTEELFKFNNIANFENPSWRRAKANIEQHQFIQYSICMSLFKLFSVFWERARCVFVFVQTPSWVTANSSPAWHVCPALKSDLHICWGLDGQYYLSPHKPRPSFPRPFLFLFALLPSHSVLYQFFLCCGICQWFKGVTAA